MFSMRSEKFAFYFKYTSFVCKTIDVSAKLMYAKANKSLQQSLNVCITNDITIY